MTEITKQDLAIFVQKHWRHGHCSKCGNNRWASGEPGEGRCTVPMSYGNRILSGMVLPVYWVMCETCGVVEFIAEHVLLKWKLGRERGEGPVNDA